MYTTILYSSKSNEYEAIYTFEYLTPGTVIKFGADESESDSLKVWTVESCTAQEKGAKTLK